MFDTNVKRVNAVIVKFQKKRRQKAILFPKPYTFKIHRLQAKNVKVGQVLYVKDCKGKTAPVVVQELLELTPRECRKHKAILTNVKDTGEVKI